MGSTKPPIEPADSWSTTFGAWILVRLLLLLGCAGAGITALITHSMAWMVLVAGFALVASLLDGFVLRIRFITQPVAPGTIREDTALDLWQPVAAFALLSQIGQFGYGLHAPIGQHVALALLAVATWVAIAISRRIYA